MLDEAHKSVLLFLLCPQILHRNHMDTNIILGLISLGDEYLFHYFIHYFLLVIIK